MTAQITRSRPHWGWVGALVVLAALTALVAALALSGTVWANVALPLVTGFFGANVDHYVRCVRRGDRRRVRGGRVLTVDIYLDSVPENMTPELALHAECVLDERWNGWLRPLATADEFGAFLDRWRANDRNGIWGYVTEVGDPPDAVLVYLASDNDEPEEFPCAGASSTGEAVYDLTGWVWSPHLWDG